MIQKQKSSGVVIVTNAGGVGVVCLDLIAKSNLQLYKIENNLKDNLVNILPKSASIHNPIDILGDSKSDRYKLVLERLVLENEIDAIIVIVTPQIMTDTVNIAQIIVDLSYQKPQIPIIPVFIGGSLVRDSHQIFQKNAFPVYHTPQSAIKSLEKYLNYKNNGLKLSQSNLKSPNFSKMSSEIVELDQLINASKAASLDFITVQKIAKLYQIPTTDFELIATDGIFDKTLAAKFLDKHPKLVVKVVSAGILHRSEQKMIELNITNLSQIENFYTKFEAQKPDVVLQEMVPDGIQCFIGVNRDPQFGNVLAIGLGGIYAEIINDFVLIPLPTTTAEIETKLKQTKLYQILNGARNKFWDIQTFIKTAHQLSQILDQFPQISSIDVNPYIAQEKGGKVVDFKVIAG